MNQISQLAGTNELRASEAPPVRIPKFRIFGTQAEDLRVDFNETDTPALVTQILAQCANAESAEFFWNLAVGKRLEYLLRLAAGDAAKNLSFPFKCGSCGGELELELTLDEISRQQAGADLRSAVEIAVGGQKFALRVPRGADQRSWQTFDFSDERRARREMILSLQIPDKKTAEYDADYDDEVFGLIDEAMDEADPLVNFNCRVSCGECAAVNEFESDLCEYALAELRREQWRLLYSVHRLAKHYHWSESEIFAVPHWRRLQYLALIGGEEMR